MTKTARRLIADLPAASTPLDGTELVVVEIAGRKYRVPVIDVNDREADVWTPVLSDGTNDAAAYSNQSGKQYRHGPLMFLTGEIRTSDLGSVSGALQISGLPEVAAASVFGSLVVGFASGLAITAGHVVTGRILGGQQVINLGLWDNTTGSTNLLDTEWTADGWIRFSVWYPIN